MHDSLNIIYPTPPTPLQQFSPLNANPILSSEDPQAKRRRLAEEQREYSETEEEEYVNENENISRNVQSKLNGFLKVGNLAKVSLLYFEFFEINIRFNK